MPRYEHSSYAPRSPSGLNGPEYASLWAQPVCSHSPSVSREFFCVILYMKRDSRLQKQITKCRAVARKFGYKLSVDTTEDDESYIITNEETKKAVIIGLVEINGDEVTVSYSMNIYKWKWALDEGFTRDEIMDKLSDEVFSTITLEYAPYYLCDQTK